MSTVITDRELRIHGSEILSRLDEGESFVIARRGFPVGELTPLRRRHFITAESAASMFRRAPSVRQHKVPTRSGRRR